MISILNGSFDFSLQLMPIKDLSFIRTNGKIVNSIDLKQIEKNATNYKNFAELRNDMSWIAHNCEVCTVYFNQNLFSYYFDYILFFSLQVQHQNKKILNASKSLLELVDAEIRSIETCHECYALASTHPDDSFVMTCSIIHPVIWAKSSGFTYWPAKAMKFENGVINVRYFGDHETDNVPLANYYAFSQQPPEKTPLTETDNILYEASLTV